jgi:hypothetical protein
MQYARDFPSRVRIHGAPETLTAIQEDPVISNPIKKMKLRLVELESEEKLGGGGTLTHFPQEHPEPCIGFRLD